MLKHYGDMVDKMYIVVYRQSDNDTILQEIQDLGIEPYMVFTENKYNWKRETEIYNSKIQTSLIEPRESVLEILEHAHLNKIKIGFVTSTTSNNIDSVFKTLNGKVTKEDFEFIGNQNMVQKLKPYPDIYLEALRVLEIETTECIAIEDSVESALSAHSAKIDCIAFPGQFHKDDDFSFCKKIMNKLDVTILN